MAGKVGEVTLNFDVTGLEDLTTLTRSLKQLLKAFKPLNEVGIKNLNKGIKETIAVVPKTINQFKQKERTLKALRDEVKIGGSEFKKLGKAIDQNRAKLQAFNQTGKKSKGMFAGLGAGGTAAIGGVGAYIGSSLGIPPAIAGLASAGAAASTEAGGSALAGGLAGAGIGAGITAVAGGVDFAKQAAIQASQVQKLEIALRGAVKTEADFQKGLEIIANTSKTLNVPIAASTKQFTTLAASVIGAGGSIEDAKVVFEGVSNSIKATGGNAEDVQSAIRAMSQIFGKGKVSAEELQGQLGERLAGAVVKFAEANGSSLQKLQKDLRDGTVGLDQVIKFAQKLNIDFAETAKRVANSSADAGQRLQTQFQNLSITIGKDLIPVGAALQKQFSEILLGFQGNEGAVVALTESFKIFGGFLVSTVALVRTLVRVVVDLTRILVHLFDMDFASAGKVISKGFQDFAINFEKDKKLLAEIANGVQPPEAGGSGSNTTTEGLPKLTEDQSKKAQSILDKYAESVRDVNSQIANSFVNTFKKLEDSLVEFVQTGTLNFRKLAQSIINDITRIFIRSKIISPLLKGFEKLFGGGNKSVASTVSNAVPAFKGFNPANAAVEGFETYKFTPTTGNPFDSGMFYNFKPNALGNVIANNKIVPYAKGGVLSQYANNDGIVTRPTTFPMKNGTGLMGEAGPEAIMPLKRGKDGKLGVTVTNKNENSRNILSQIISGVAKAINKNTDIINNFALGGVIDSKNEISKYKKGNIFNEVIEEGDTSNKAFLKGSVFTNVVEERETFNNINKYANGGIFNKPEAIMPLKRGKDGRLGVIASEIPSNLNNVITETINRVFNISETKKTVKENALGNVIENKNKTTAYQKGDVFSKLKTVSNLFNNVTKEEAVTTEVAENKNKLNQLFKNSNITNSVDENKSKLNQLFKNSNITNSIDENKNKLNQLFKNSNITNSVNENKNKITKFAKGGLIERPTIFPLSNGAGIAGEKSFEAIMPLSRDKNGKLGVIARGGETTNIVVNVDVSSSSVQSDGDGQQFGEAIATAIQLELVKQKRSGGLLA